MAGEARSEEDEKENDQSMNMSELTTYNFSAGPACLPKSVLERAHQEFFNFGGTGMSVMEMSHRSAEFIKITDDAEADMRDLLKIPANYKVLFLTGGGTGEFAAVPLNLLCDDKPSADFLVSGLWSKKAAQEMSKYGKPNIVATSEATKFTKLPVNEGEEVQVSQDAAYFHYCANETVHGVEFPFIPSVPAHVPLVADFSSNFMSGPLDVSRFGLIYAGAQKNIGPAGVTVVIVREDLIGHASKQCPSVFDFKQMADNQSMLNTPPCYSIYIVGLVMKWMKEQGGLDAIWAANTLKAELLYSFIDQSNGYYSCPVDKSCRSRMNVPFRICGGNEELEKKFIKQSTAVGLVNLAGHRSVGGLRASIYNAMPLAGVQALVDFMARFKVENQS